MYVTSLTMKFRWNFGLLLIFAGYSAAFDCHNTMMDIAMVIPTKKNVGDENYATMIRSLENLIKQFSVLTDRAHVAIVQFAKQAKVRFDASDLSKPNELSRVIEKLKKQKEDLGKDVYNTFNALKLASDKVFKQGNDDRPSSIDVIVLFTHKSADDESGHVIEELEGKGIYRVVVNIGNEITEEELQLITGGNEGVFQAGTFDILEDRTDDIHNITCNMLNCEDPPLDICLVIDQTESVRQHNYISMLRSVNDFTHFFVIGENKTRFAVVTFAEYASVRIPFSNISYQDQDRLSGYLHEMEDDELSSPTRTDRALAKAGKEVFNETNGDRPEAPGVLIVLTDGKTHDDSEPFDKVLKEVKEKNVHRIAVGIGPKVVPWQLREIAGDNDSVITVRDFKELSKTLRRLREVTCSINGGYSKWTNWTECSVSCDGGVRWRNRTCTQPVPKHRGKDCTHLGPNVESEACNTMECGHDGNFTNWSNWSVCSSDCGGVQIRYRLCTRPPPSGLGKNCTGNTTETRPCGNNCPEPLCKAGLDLGLLIDRSKSIRKQYYKLLLREFLPNFLKQLEIGRETTRVGIVLFDRKARFVNDFRSKLSFNLKKLIRKVKRLPLRVIFQTRFDLGLEMVSERLFTKEGGDRKNKSNALVVFTDGKPFPPDEVKPFQQLLPPLRTVKQVDIEFVGYGPPDKMNFTNLQAMAAPKSAITLTTPESYSNTEGPPSDLKEVVCALPDVDGGYTSWTQWSGCSNTCGSGVQIRSRSCTAPPQQKGGRDCSRFGPFSEIQQCNLAPCAADVYSRKKANLLE